ncbi:DNA-binding protein [Nocardia paucivorans]|uniref:DNA-binding protein n=1 Tax=Nocardia paucivorans TaxID=114259 RepID=UPI00031028C8|nr:DNA-binding protein [Nocardia paucivorans]
MAHGRLNPHTPRRSSPPHHGTLVLDCEGLSRLVDDCPRTVALVAEARACGMEMVISALTIIEATHRKTDRARLSWLLSAIRIEPIDESTAKAASALLRAAGLHGHRYVIDSVVAEMALRQPPPVVMLTGDPEDMGALCGLEVRVVSL